MKTSNLLLLLAVGVATLPSPGPKEIKCSIPYLGNDTKCEEAGAHNILVYNYETTECDSSFHACDSADKIIKTDDDCRRLCESEEDVANKVHQWEDGGSILV